ncbi:MAG: hypothetical protein AAF571_08620 [Verrucomicrobiota bacterium]
MHRKRTLWGGRGVIILILALVYLQPKQIEMSVTDSSSEMDHDETSTFISTKNIENDAFATPLVSIGSEAGLEWLAKSLQLHESECLKYLVGVEVDNEYFDIAKVICSHFAEIPTLEALQRLEVLRPNSILFDHSVVGLLRDHLNTSSLEQIMAYMNLPQNANIVDVAAFQVGEAFSIAEPGDTLNWLSKQRETHIRNQVMHGALETWIREDVSQASEWMSVQKAQPVLDEPILSMIRRNKDDTAIDEVLHWLSAIHNENLRSAGKVEVLQYYSQFYPEKYEVWAADNPHTVSEIKAASFQF